MAPAWFQYILIAFNFTLFIDPDTYNFELLEK